MDISAKLKSQKSQNMAREIRKNLEINDEVFNAFCAVQRDIFVPQGLKFNAYSLDALPIAGSQWISSPLSVAKMTKALLIDKSVDSVLEIGCGSGYQAAILSKMIRRVFTIERIETLVKETRDRFEKLQLSNIHVRFDDGKNGWRDYAPFDRILFSASIKEIPSVIFEQLRDGGVLVAPIEKDGEQIITRFVKQNGKIESVEVDKCYFIGVKDGTSSI